MTAGLMLAAGCGSPPPEPAVVEIPGYEALQEQCTGRDMSPLRGRRIVLDPGHGGFFKGAVGPDGLTEAEVNLGVALYLRGLLEWVGAEAFLTRTADYDFLTPSDSTLVADLAFRSSFSDSLQPDVFLSLHHNSVASLDRTVNETQTYYPLGADGASLDLARAIHRHLVINLEISPAKILPGNFHVLRNATVPAVLGEPAMISNPVIEGRLKQAASQRLEAEAVRDVIMATSGGIDLEVGGKPIFPYIPQEILDTAQAYGRWDNQIDGPDVWRRSLYVYRRRTLSYPFFETFDLPDQNITTASRNTSTVAPQALTLLNNPFVLRQADLFAREIEERAPYDVERQIQLAYERGLTRAPTPAELEISRSLVEIGSLADLTHVIFNLSEFLYRR